MAQEEGASQRKHQFLVNPEEPAVLVDGFSIEHLPDGLFVLSLFLSNRHGTMEPSDTNSSISFCHGRYVMSETALAKLKGLLNQKRLDYLNPPQTQEQE